MGDYDADHRLVDQRTQHDTRQFAYDAAGNITGTPGSGTIHYAPGNLLARAGFDHYETDARYRRYCLPVNGVAENRSPEIDALRGAKTRRQPCTILQSISAEGNPRRAFATSKGGFSVKERYRQGDWQSKSDQDQIVDECVALDATYCTSTQTLELQSLANREEQLRTGAAITYTAGGVAVAARVTMMVLGKKGRTKERTGRFVEPFVGTQSAGVMGRFLCEDYQFRDLESEWVSRAWQAARWSRAMLSKAVPQVGLTTDRGAWRRREKVVRRAAPRTQPAISATQVRPEPMGELVARS